MATFLIYGDDVTAGLTVCVDDGFMPRLTKALRETKKALSPCDVAQMLGGEPGDARRVNATIRVQKWACTLRHRGEDTFMRVGSDGKPGLNAISDGRKRPLPD